MAFSYSTFNFLVGQHNKQPLRYSKLSEPSEHEMTRHVELFGLVVSLLEKSGAHV